MKRKSLILVCIALVSAAVGVAWLVLGTANRADEPSQAQERSVDAAQGLQTAGDNAGTSSAGQSSAGISPSEADARAITFTYDAAGRLIAVDYGGGQRITYTYDSAGNLLEERVASREP